MADFIPNPRYRHFTQEIFTAGDYEQFVSKVATKRALMSCPDEKIVMAIFELEDHPRWTWEKYACGNDLFTTFEYIFHKFKKGLYVQIQDNRLRMFLPFSNVDYHNEYASSLKVDLQKHDSFEKMYQKICEYEGREYLPNKVCWYPYLWYCNNGLVRYEYPMKENDSGINMLYDMFTTLCAERQVPDCEFFVNKRDFPILSMHGYEPYTALVDDKTPLYSYNLDSYLPILSMCTKKDHADIPIPTWEDWSRVSYLRHGRTFPKLHKSYPSEFCLDWRQKKRTLVFRGASTGLGTTIETNPRLYFAKLCQTSNRCWDGSDEPYLDIGIAKWNTRPRKQCPSDFLDIPDIHAMGMSLVESMTPVEQSTYRYILHLPGHSCAYRLSLELGMGSVLFMYPSDYYLWYTHLLEPYEHYIPLERGMDATEVFEKLEWCESHPVESERIARNARAFYERVLSYESTLDALQSVCVRIARHFRFDQHVHVDMTPVFKRTEDAIAVQEDSTEPSRWEMIRQTKRSTIYHDKEGGRLIKYAEDEDFSHAHAVSCVLREDVIERKLCDNFVCSLGYDRKCLIMPYEGDGTPMDEYLMDTACFRMNQLRGILTQLALAVQIAQQRTMFVHYDLAPWNVVLYRCSDRQQFFHQGERTACLQGCKFKAKIIDFEYASVVCHNHDDAFIHRIKPFFVSDRHDMVTLVYNTFHIILKHQRLSRQDIDWVKDVVHFLSGRRFHNIQDLKRFLTHERKFSRLLLTGERGRGMVRNTSSFQSLDHHHHLPSFMNKLITHIGYYGMSIETNRTVDTYVRSLRRDDDDQPVFALLQDAHRFQKGLEKRQASFNDVSEAECADYADRTLEWKRRTLPIDFHWKDAIAQVEDEHDDGSLIPVEDLRWYTHVPRRITKLTAPICTWVERAHLVLYMYHKGYVSQPLYNDVVEWLQNYEQEWVRIVSANFRCTP